MSGAQKRFEQMARNPKGDWTVNDIQTVCRDNDLTCEPPSGGGSHWKISSPYLDEILTVPTRRPIKPVYIRAFVGFVLKSREVR
jgi:hypothetical protein